jgi:hypothetical protein
LTSKKSDLVASANPIRYQTRSAPPTQGSGVSEIEAYFITHAPGEWWHDPATRTEFATLYGSQALLALDATGRVPDNIDQNFTTQA